jgi:hypothetical protein
MLYSASLIDAKKFNLTAYSRINPSGEIKTAPAPDPFAFDAPSTNNFHSAMTELA